MTYEKQAVWPKSIVNLPFDIPWSKGVRFDGLDWICGMGGGPGAPPDDFAATLELQTDEVMLGIEDISKALGTDRADAVHMVMFYKQDGARDEDEYRRYIHSLLPQGDRIVLTMIPCTHFAPHTMLLEVDAWMAARGGHAPRFARLPDGTVGAVRTGDLIQIGSIVACGAQGLEAQTDAIFALLDDLLGQLGATREDMVRLDTWFRCDGDEEAVHAQWRRSAKLRRNRFSGHGPAIADMPVTALWPADALIACAGFALVDMPKAPLAVDGQWQWDGFGFPQAVRAGPYLFLSAQKPLDGDGRLIGVGDIRAQTHAAMSNAGRLLEAAGMGFLDVLRMNVRYRGPSGMDELFKNIEVRRRFWPEGQVLSPTVSTGVPSLHLTHPGQLYEVLIVGAR